MSSKLNTEFNYRFQVMGETPWHKLKYLKDFLEGRKRAAVLEEVAELKHQAKLDELENTKKVGALPHVIKNLQAELLELESFLPSQQEAFELNRQEIAILEKLIAEIYEIAEPSRIQGYDDEAMFEATAGDEFTAMILKDMLSEKIAYGHALPATIRNAMRYENAFLEAKKLGLIPTDSQCLQIDFFKKDLLSS